MSASSVVLLKRTEVAPAYKWYVDLDEYLELQSDPPEDMENSYVDR